MLTPILTFPRRGGRDFFPPPHHPSLSQSERGLIGYGLRMRGRDSELTGWGVCEGARMS